MLHTMTPDIAQLDLWVRDIVPNVKFPVGAPAGPVTAGVNRLTSHSGCSMSIRGKPLPPEVTVAEAESEGVR